MITEEEIRGRIKFLEERLQLVELMWYSGNIYTRNRAIVSALNVESQLDALYFVLGEKYVYKHK